MVRTDFSEALYCVVLAWHFAFVMAANDRCELCQPVAVRNRDKQNVMLLIPVKMTSSHGGVLGSVNIICMHNLNMIQKKRTENKSSLLVVFYKLTCICPLVWFLSPLKANQASVNKGLPQHLLQQIQWLSF